MATYGYIRVSTAQQNPERQEEAIKTAYPDATILDPDEVTGKTMDRKIWNSLVQNIKPGDTIIFDEVSRMSRDAEEGFREYLELYSKGVNLIFLKEPHINTAVYEEVAQAPETGDKDLDETLIPGLNGYLMRLAKKQIQIAFERSQQETELRSARQKGALKRLKEENDRLKIMHPDDYREQPAYTQIGRETGSTYETKKKAPIKALIKKYSRDFDGANTDEEVMALLKTKEVKVVYKKRSGRVGEKMVNAGVARNTYFRYKKELREELK